MDIYNLDLQLYLKPAAEFQARPLKIKYRKHFSFSWLLLLKSDGHLWLVFPSREPEQSGTLTNNFGPGKYRQDCENLC